jgi:hypothetical protein
MRRRKGPRLAAVVDHIKADDGPEFEALVKRIAELGFGQARQDITLEKFFLSNLDLLEQMSDALAQETNAAGPGTNNS